MRWQDDGRKQFTGIHKHAPAFEIEEKMGQEIARHFKFAFVRNPFDWNVSLYFYIKQSKHHRMHSRVEKMEFAEFLRWHISQKPARQVDFLMDRAGNDFVVDFIGLIETLDRYIQNILQTLNLPSIYRGSP